MSSKNAPAAAKRGKRYWRSLEQLAGDPTARAFQEREFPEGASELPQGIDRRTMITLVGASLSMAGLSACRPVEKIVPYVEAPEQVVPGIPRRYATTMPLGLGGYGLVVESHEGRPTKIEGNTLHPSTGGSSSAWLQASILDLYDPDRSRSPMQGVERKGWADFVAAWQALEPAHLEDGGAGLAVLTEPFSSPTMARLATAFRERFPQARSVAWEPVSDENVYRGIEKATGTLHQPVLHVGWARVILALDSDFLLTESESVRHARGFADARRVASTADSMSRLYVVEGVHSVTGANADHRLRLRTSRATAFVVALAARLQARGLNLELPAAARSVALPEVEPHWLDALADDLMANRGAGLIVAGRRQPPAVHAAVHALNAALGNVGATVIYRPITDAAPSDGKAFAALVAAMTGGAVKTLIVLGGNPVYNAPADVGFEQALSNVENVVHLGSHRDETSVLSQWHLPRAHYLESWSDVRAAGGTLGVVQPLIEPLFGGKSDVELLGLLATGEDRAGYDLVRETWSARLGDADFERRWRRVLHDGLLEEPTEPAADEQAPAAEPYWPQLLAAASAQGPGEGGLELVFQLSSAVHDGRFANNGWLQELPDPITKLTWDNAALLSPATAREHGLRNEDVVRLSYRGREIETPVWIVPGQADGTVGLVLGYGRRAAGRIGDGTGVDVYALRHSDALDFGGGVSLEKTGRRYPLSQTQDHGSMTEPDMLLRKGRRRPIVREATLEEFRHEPTFAREMVEVPHTKALWHEREYDQGYQWGMTIDLNACIGCNACVVACQSENNVPIVGKDQVRRGREMHWLRVDRYFEGGEDDPQTVFQAVPCMQCENAPCEQVCPVAATTHDEEGLNVMVYNRCIGTRYCSNNCPYKVRRFNFYNFTKHTPETMRLAQNPDVTVRSRGVMEKCSYCLQRLSAAKIQAKLDGREVRDGEIQTACQQACPARAIEFGNIRDTESRVAVSKRQDRNYGLLEELHTKPRTTYLAKLRNRNEELS
jgi:molybdopterin-containing oxidoreductase family iron-sulfur binding subunit